MDWNAKWDWENLVLFNPKTTERLKLQTAEWGIEEEEEGMMETGTFNLSEGKGSTSGSELAPGSSARSSISVCTDSSFKEVMKNTQVAFGALNAFSGDLSKKEDLRTAEQTESSLFLESSAGSGEPLIGLELGKRMYFENHSIGGNSKTSSLPGVPLSSIATTVKKIKSSGTCTPSRCQVEGCNLDLSSAKEYHRKHRVCASHSKCPKVVVGGLERRFCQQCSRFHSLSEFDERKRSCRRRLSDHNARRRKPQLDSIQFSSMRLPSPFSDGRQQMSVASNNSPLASSRSLTDPIWESACSSKVTTTKECMLRFGITGGLDEPMQLPATGVPHTLTMTGQGSSRILPFKGTKAEPLTRGSKKPVLSSNLGLAPDLHRALSLLSNDSWGSSFSPSNNSLDHSINVNHMHQPLVQGFPQMFPQTSSEFCQTGHSADGLATTASDTSHFQLFKAPYDNALYSNLFN